ncbi:MAG: sigma-70 family RNA polymerase sigma factor [Clostridia bacterium]|nr:sigma-70 family RNA polymerase sigma factor [Clostridia bacterium]
MKDKVNLTDEEVVKKVIESDHELYAIIIERYQDKLLRYTYNLIRDSEKSKDSVQETFIRAYTNLNIFNTQKKFSSWIYQIAHNQAINIAKKNHREIPLLDDLDFESPENIEDNFDQEKDVGRINLCLKDIPILYREPLSLYYIEEKTYQEISDILRIPMGTVATRINRAKKIMKNICQKN